MIRTAFWAFVAVTVFFVSSTVAHDVKVNPSSNIPFKENSTPFEDHGSRVGLGILIFLLVSGGVIYGFRKKISALTTLSGSNDHLKVVKQARLNPRSALYVVEFNQRKLLIGQSGDYLVCLDASTQPANEKNND